MAQRLGTILLSCGLSIFACSNLRADTPSTQPSDEAKYETSINKRADEVNKALALTDSAKAAKVHEIVAGQYRKLHDIDAAADEATKAANKDKDKLAAIKADADTKTKALHQEFVDALSKELTAEQVDIVKDKMTYSVLHVTYKAYCDMIPKLTDEQKTYIMQQLTEARELAMDGGSSQEKHAIFGKYKGRINIYLSKAGYNMKEEENGWRERIKAQKQGAAPTTQHDN